MKARSRSADSQRPMDHHEHHQQDMADRGEHLEGAAHGAGHDRHAGHSVAAFRDKFWLTLALTIPPPRYRKRVIPEQSAAVKPSPASSAKSHSSSKSDSLDLQPLGDGAYEIGRATLTLAGGQRATPKYVAVWKYEDGAWRRHVDIWNMDTA